MYYLILSAVCFALIITVAISALFSPTLHAKLASLKPTLAASKTTHQSKQHLSKQISSNAANRSTAEPLGLDKPPVQLQSRPKPQLMLASTRAIKSLPEQTSGYYVSEKFDGVRAFWTGSSFITRQGFTINPPDWFVEHFPNHPLDGELWTGHHRFDEVSAIARKLQPSDQDWKKVSYLVFDSPIPNLAFHQRKKRLEDMINDQSPSWLRTVEHLNFETKSELNAFYEAVITNQGEGVMLNISNATYQAGRTNSILKIKPKLDDEALVTGYQEGKGKYKGLMGALWVKHKSGLKFKIGSGFTDHDRKFPPALGSIISYQYSGLSKNGLPRFARYLRERTDLSVKSVFSK